MKILQINNSIERTGGAEVVLINTINTLEENGHEVISFSLPVKDYNANKIQKSFFLNTRSLLHNSFYSFTAARQVKKIIKEENPDIIHIHNIIGGVTFSVLKTAQKCKVPVVATLHDFRLLCPAYSFINGKDEICEKCLTGKYYNAVLNNCSKKGIIKSGLIMLESYLRDALLPFTKLINEFIFVSEFSSNIFVRSYPVIKNKSNVIYNPSRLFEKSKVRGSYFLYFGRLIKIKGIETLIEAFRQMPDKKLIIAGEGPLKEIAKKRKSPNIEVVGYKYGLELENLIKHANFIIVSSECHENSPMSIIESFSFAKPVIGSNIGGIPELISEGKNGFLFESGNVENLIETVQKADSMNQYDFDKMSDNALNYSIEKNSIQNYFSSISSIYEGLIANNREKND